MDIVGNNVRPDLTHWFEEVFLKSYNSRPEPNEITRQGKNGEYIDRESRRGLTTTQLETDMAKVGIYIDSEDIRKKFIRPLTSQGYISNEKSALKGNERIYYPTGKRMGVSILDKDKRLPVKSSLYPTLEKITESLENLRTYGHADLGNSPVFMFEGKEISIADLAKRCTESAKDIKRYSFLYQFISITS